METALRAYGPEIYRFLRAFTRSEQDADEVFSIACERAWVGLPAFTRACSFRTWLYTIARNAAHNQRDHAKVRARVHAPLPESSRLEEIAAAVRTETATHLRTETKSRIARLRESLSEQDRMLLTLRVDRQLEWNELARVLHDGTGEELEGEALRRASARLRKRFQDVKEKLAELARREGLLNKEG